MTKTSTTNFYFRRALVWFVPYPEHKTRHDSRNISPQVLPTENFVKYDLCLMPLATTFINKVFFNIVHQSVGILFSANLAKNLFKGVCSGQWGICQVDFPWFFRTGHHQVSILRIVGEELGAQRVC